MERRKILATKEDMRLYAVTDRSWLGDKTLVEAVEEACRGGITFLQLREKDLNPEDFMEEARVLKKVAQKYQIPFVINDNVAIAKEVDADGVHVGQSDMELKKAREILGPDKIIGVSAHNVEEAVLAEKNGADYLGVGAFHATGTKEEAKVVDRETYQAIRSAVSIPVVAIGGISLENIGELKGYGVDGVALVSAIFASRDIEAACRCLREEVEKIVG